MSLVREEAEKSTSHGWLRGAWMLNFSRSILAKGKELQKAMPEQEKGPI